MKELLNIACTLSYDDGQNKRDNLLCLQAAMDHLIHESIFFSLHEGESTTLNQLKDNINSRIHFTSSTSAVLIFDSEDQQVFPEVSEILRRSYIFK